MPNFRGSGTPELTVPGSEKFGRSLSVIAVLRSGRYFILPHSDMLYVHRSAFDYELVSMRDSELRCQVLRHTAADVVDLLTVNSLFGRRAATQEIAQDSCCDFVAPRKARGR